jgi:hypothetical protein
VYVAIGQKAVDQERGARAGEQSQLHSPTIVVAASRFGISRDANTCQPTPAAMGSISATAKTR